jgi:outer membrane protein OmpA-like peptidoglycan-associated protein
MLLVGVALGLTGCAAVTQVDARVTQVDGRVIDIVGYTDASGGNRANDQLSWRREEVVRRYLTEKAPVIHRISFVGLGEEKADGARTDAADRQVAIAIYRPE